MRALAYDEFGPIDSFAIVNIDAPEPAGGQVLIDVDCVGLNFFDTLLIEGSYQVRPERPFSPGGELAGTVRKVGSGVSTVAAGDRVYAYLGHGALRDQVLADHRYVVKLPTNSHPIRPSAWE